MNSRLACQGQNRRGMVTGSIKRSQKVSIGLSLKNLWPLETVSQIWTDYASWLNYWKISWGGHHCALRKNMIPTIRHSYLMAFKNHHIHCIGALNLYLCLLERPREMHVQLPMSGILCSSHTWGLIVHTILTLGKVLCLMWRVVLNLVWNGLFMVPVNRDKWDIGAYCSGSDGIVGWMLMHAILASVYSRAQPFNVPRINDPGENVYNRASIHYDFSGQCIFSILEQHVVADRCMLWEWLLYDWCPPRK